MSSKLDYLKKYLAKPGDSAQTQCQKKKKKVLKEPQSLQIRDLSEVLPQSRIEEPIRKRRPIDEEVTFVDEKQVEAAQKLDHEVSGVRWKIMQHRKGPPREALRGAGLAVKKEEPEDSDISPPRSSKRSARNTLKSTGDDDLSPPCAAKGGRQQKRDDSDLSPPRQETKARQKADDSDLSPPRKETKARQKADDSDLSPPRADPHAGRRPPPTNGGGDLSPPRASAHVKNEQDSDKDLSPPRRAIAAKASKQHDSDVDLSPPRRLSTKGREHGEPAAASAQDPNSDLSPPRDTEMTKRRHMDPNCQPAQRHDSDADLSPPRQGKADSKKIQKASARHDSDADLSPPRQGKGNNKKKLQKASARHDSDADLSPPRQGEGDSKSMQKASARNDSDADLSPPRQQSHQRHDSDVDLSPPRREDRKDRKGEEQQRMSSGLRSGLVRGQDLKSEAAVIREKRKAELEKAPDHETGRGAETVYRNREGQRIGREEWAEQQQKKRRKKLSEYPEQELEWGGGIKQKYNKEAEQAEVSRIAAQPFARYKPDDKYLEELQDRRDWNDPMRQFEDDDEGTSTGAAATSGAAPKKEVQKPKCPHAPWLNRFNILPGYRWDGKVRGNDYERKWLEARNQREYDKQEAWKYDMEEM